MTLSAALASLLGEVKLARGEGCKPVVRQLYEMGHVALRWQMRPNEYYLYGFHRRDKDYGDAFRYLTLRTQNVDFFSAVNDDRWGKLLENKWLFQAYYGNFGFAQPKNYGLLEASFGFDLDRQPLKTAEDLERLLFRLRVPAVVIKPIGGTRGQGVLVVDEIRYGADGIALRTASGERLRLADLESRLPEVEFGGYRGYLVQERLRQHPFLDVLCPSTLNTIRVVTFLLSDSDVAIDFSVLRLGREGNSVDGWLRGGVCVPIEKESGVLGVGRLAPGHGDREVDRHPDTDVGFTGSRLPSWEGVLEMCRAAARLLPGVRSVGWDVAVTPDGPVLMEANPNWNLEMVQVHGNGYLHSATRERLRSFGLSFPDRLPPVNWRLSRDSLRRWITTSHR